MPDPRRTIDFESYLRARVIVLNDSGSRGYDRGLRTYNCPLCDDKRGRGWAHVTFWLVGCFNNGCDAEGRLEGGAVEFVRLLERLRDRTETWRFLRARYGTTAPIFTPPIKPRQIRDFVKWPDGMRRFSTDDSPMKSGFVSFIKRQWKLSERDAQQWGLGFTLTGYYAWRVVIPIVMNLEPVGFQARTIQTESQAPKYLTSEYGKDCGRPAAAMLHNADSLREDEDALMVEGAGDVMGWHRGNMNREPRAFGLLGLALTADKIAILSSKKVGCVIVAVDAEPAAQARAKNHLEDLLANDIEARLGTWRGGKDAGSGATLVRNNDVRSLEALVRERNRYSR